MELTKTKLKVHPLFFLAGCLSAFTGDLLLFLSAVLAALEHECAHAIAARSCGFSLDKIVLMPYGAVISGDIRGISPKQELFVLLSGPLSNAATALAFAALWWLYPETYAYTDTAAYISLSLFLVNLLPAYPLDGGRALKLALRKFGNRGSAICRAVSVFTALAVLCVFIVSCFSSPSFSALFFSLCLFLGSFGGGSYSPVVFSKQKAFSRGVEERRVAISAERDCVYAMRFLREDKYLVFILFDDETFLGELTEEEFLRAAQGDFHKTLKQCFLAG